MSALRCASRAGLVLLLLVGWLTPRSAHAEDVAAPASSYQHRMAQGRFFLQAGLARQALTEFEAAALLHEGQSEPEVHQLLAQTRYALGEIGGAVESARTAAALSPRLSPEFAEFHDFLTSRFGKVLVVGGASEGALTPAPATPLLDPELKRAFLAARSRLETFGDGSTSIYLPVGTYRVGGHIVEVVAKGVTRMDLRPVVDASGSGVYGERRRESKSESKGSSKPKKPASSHPASGALLVRGGGSGYAQQGSGSGGARLLVGPELGLAGGRMVLDAALMVGLTRAERVVGGSGAPPAPLVGGRVSVAAAVAVGSTLRLGPMLGWSMAGASPVSAGLPDGYDGPRQYVTQGPELGVRLVGEGRGVRPLLQVFGFLHESTPAGVSTGPDTSPHLTAGVGVDLGMRIQ